MSSFNELFMFLATDGDPANRQARESELVRTTFVPVADADSAAAEVRARVDEGLDLVELYGGFGPKRAAAVIDAADGRAPVGLVGVEERPVLHQGVIFAAVDADPSSDRYEFDQSPGRTTFVAVPGPEDVPRIAGQLAAEGVERLEICGGLGPVPTAAAIEAIGDRVRVGSVMFGFESLPAVADYRRRFEAALAG